MSASLENLLPHYQACLSSYLKLKENPSEQECTVLLSRFSKSLNSKTANLNHVMKTLYFLVEKVCELQNNLDISTGNIEKCFRAILRDISLFFTIDSSTVDLFLAILKLMHAFMRNHASAKIISSNIYTIGESIFTLLWRFIIKSELDPIKIIQAKIRALNFCILPPHYTISRYFVYHLANVYKAHLEEKNAETSEKISQIIVNQSLKWLQILQFNMDTIKELLKSNSNFFSLILVQVMIAFGSKEKPFSGKNLLKTFLKEISLQTDNKRTLLSIGLVLALVRICSADSSDISTGLCQQIDTILNSVPDLDTCPFYPHFYQSFSILFKETLSLVEKQTDRNKTIYFKWLLRILAFFSKNFMENFEDFCTNFADEIEFKVSIQLNIMRSAYQLLSTQECSQTEIELFVRAFTNFYRIFAKSVKLESHFKNQPIDNYVTASIIRIHHIAVLAIKSHVLATGMEFMLNSLEMTYSFWGQVKFENSPEILNVLELFVNQLNNLPEADLRNVVKGVKDIIQFLSLDFHLGTEKKRRELFRNWIRVFLIHSKLFNETIFQILTAKYEISPKQTELILETEKEVLFSLSDVIDSEVVDNILCSYSKQEESFESLISHNPVAPLLKIAYLYDIGECNVALQQLDTILEKLNGIFDTKITLFSIQTCTLANFWIGLLSYQVGNNREMPLASNYPLIGTESDLVHIPSIPQGFLVAIEYIYIILRYFTREISECFVKELEFVLKNLIFFFKLFSNTFYLFLAFISASIYLSEFCANNFDFGIIILNDFSEFLIENAFENTFSSLDQIHKLLRQKFRNFDAPSYENILNYSKSNILSEFFSLSIGDSFEDIDSGIESSTLSSLIDCEKEYFALKHLDTRTDKQIIVYTHSQLVDLCKNIRKIAANLITDVKPSKNRSQEKGISFSILPSFLERIYKLCQVLIHSGNTQEATSYIDLGYQLSGKLCLFEWRLQFLNLGIQLDILREKSERVDQYSDYISKTKEMLSVGSADIPENISNGFAFLLKGKKLKITRNEFKNFCCVTHKTNLVSNQMVLEDFNKILISTSRSILEVETSPIAKSEFKNFQENLTEIITNLYRFFSRVEDGEESNHSFQIEKFPINEHNFTTKICQIRMSTNKLHDLIDSKSAVSVYKTALKLISGMSNTNFLLNQPQFCQVLSEFYLQSAKVLENASKKADKQELESQFFLPYPETNTNTEIIGLYTNCLKSTVPFGSVIILKEALWGLAEIYSEFDPIISSVYFNAGFGLNLRHLAINKSQDKHSYFDVLCFDPTTYSPQNSIQENFISSLENFPQDWTVLTISCPKKGQNLYISRLRKSKPPLLFKIPLTHILSYNFERSRNEYTSHGAALSSIFTLLQETVKTETKLNNARWWENKSRANNVLCETLTRMEQSWFSGWKGLFLGRLTIARELLARITNELVEFVFRLTDVRPVQREYVSELMEFLLESFPLLKQSHMNSILHPTLPKLTESEIESIASLIGRKSEVLYEELANVLDKFECTPTSVPRGHVFLILDPHLHQIPWEDFPTLGTQSTSRVPSLHFLFLLTQKYISNSRIDLSNGFYVLNPQGDLLKCEKDFKKLFHSLNWQGVSGQPPEALIDSVSAKDLYVYCGHGSGSEYVNKEKLLNSEGRAFTMLMGCSTSKLVMEGAFEYPSMLLLLLLAGYPTVIGMLWSVTDTELNLFTKKLIQEIVKESDLKFTPTDSKKNTLFAAFQQARMSCKHRYISGSAAVIYGLPLY